MQNARKATTGDAHPAARQGAATSNRYGTQIPANALKGYDNNVKRYWTLTTRPQGENGGRAPPSSPVYLCGWNEMLDQDASAVASGYTQKQDWV